MQWLEKGAEHVRTVIFPNTIRTVYGNAFKNNQSLKSAILNEGLEELMGLYNYCDYRGVFSGSKLWQVVLPTTLLTLGNATFYKCKELQRVTFTKGSRLETIGVDCFYGSGIKEITIPSSVTTIRKRAFSCCRNLKKVSLQSGSLLKTIYDYCFSDSGLEVFLAPPGLKEIECGAF